ncbi:MAG TPA: hypothetical protein VFX49_17380, partial [Chloroflexota bacterium]|nr:hypothetical protein [Chloroflexota bacterium]
MPTEADPGRILALLRDPNVESQEVADAAGVPREEAARAARLILGIARAKPEDLLTLPPALALAALRAAVESRRPELLAALAGHLAKDVAKEAKRALHLMKSRGVAV